MSEYESIYEAIEEDDRQAVRDFLNKSLDFTEDGGWNPLHAASGHGNPSIVKDIIEYIESDRWNNFDINSSFEISDGSPDYSGTALSEALLNGHKNVAKILVENGSDVNAFYYSQDADSPESFFGDFEAATDGGICWWIADNELFELMKTKDLHIDETDYADRSALGHAVLSGSPGKVAMLLASGADPSQKILHDDMGVVSLLIAAAADERVEVVKQLLKHGASLADLCVECDEESVIDIVLDRDNPELDEIFGLRNVRERLNSKRKRGKQRRLDSRLF